MAETTVKPDELAEAGLQLVKPIHRREDLLRQMREWLKSRSPGEYRYPVGGYVEPDFVCVMFLLNKRPDGSAMLTVCPAWYAQMHKTAGVSMRLR